MGPLFKAYVNKDLNRAVRKGVDEGLKFAVGYVKKHFFRHGGDPGPGYIVSRSGKLESTVTFKKARKLTNIGLIGGSLSMGDRSTPYAGILEYGGRTRPHMIVPRRSSVLVFFWPKVGKTMFLKRVSHPGSSFEPRAVLGRGMARAEPVMVKKVVRNLDKAARKRF